MQDFFEESVNFVLMRVSVKPVFQSLAVKKNLF